MKELEHAMTDRAILKELEKEYNQRKKQNDTRKKKEANRGARIQEYWDNGTSDNRHREDDTMD